MNDITKPLRLAIGAHQAGSGAGCAMNVISWENGDSTITDMPSCADPILSRLVQNVNDHFCQHVTYDSRRKDYSSYSYSPLPVTTFQFTADTGLASSMPPLTISNVTINLNLNHQKCPVRYLCAECSVLVLDLAHRTVGTSSPYVTHQEYVALAAFAAGQVIYLAVDQCKAYGLINDAQRFAYGVSRGSMKVEDAAAALGNEADEAARLVAKASSPLVRIGSPHSFYAHVQGAISDAMAAEVNAGGSYLVFAHKIIDKFEEITGMKAKPVAESVTTDAVAKMLVGTR